MSKFCTNCGSPLKKGAKFCAQCGTAIAEDLKEAMFKESLSSPTDYQYNNVDDLIEPNFCRSNGKNF